MSWRSENQTAGEGDFCPSFLYLKRVHNLPKLHDLACHCTDPGSSDECVSDNNITPLILPFTQQRFLEHLPRAIKVKCSKDDGRVFRDDHPPFLRSALSRRIPFSEATSYWTLALQFSQHFLFCVFYNSMKSYLPGLLEQFSWARNLLRKKKLQKGVAGGWGWGS